MRMESTLKRSGAAVKKTGTTYDVVSPITGRPVDRVVLAGRQEIDRILRGLSGPREPVTRRDVFAFLERLKDQLALHRDSLVEKTMLETGFIIGDSAEIVDAAIEFLEDFETYTETQLDRNQVMRHSYSSECRRHMRIATRPYRCVAAVVPQNASLTLSIVIIASALHAGSQVVLRPPLQCTPTGDILADLVRRSDPPERCLEIINCVAGDFMDACCASDHVDLVHYIGSNAYAMRVLQQTFAAGKVCLLDGQGNGMLYVDGTFPLEDAISLITSGATRYNGETCTSVNGVLAHPDIYDDLLEGLVESFAALTIGDPADQETKIGPLFSEKQALAVQASLKNSAGSIVSGNAVRGAYFEPAVVKGVEPGETLVCEGVFGPVLWIRPVSEQDIPEWLTGNRFPLSDTVLTERRDLIRTFARNSPAARICVNADPSVESMFEPWGGYPPSGLNPVSVWIEKYRQVFQLDGRLRDILPATSEPGSGAAV